MNLTTHCHLVPKVRMSGDIHLPPIYLHGVDRDNFTFLTGINISMSYIKEICGLE